MLQLLFDNVKNDYIYIYINRLLKSRNKQNFTVCIYFGQYFYKLALLSYLLL